MEVAALLDKLSSSEPEPVYVLHGPERFLVDEAIARLRAAVLAGPMAELNFRRMRAEDCSGAEILAEARSMPMLAKRRLVVVESVDKLKTDDWDVLDPYLAAPHPETCLVLVAAHLDLRKGAVSRANRRGQVHKAEPLKDDRVGEFARSRAAARKVRLDPGAVAALGAAVGADCAALDDAVERLGLYAGEGGLATEKDVAEVVTAVRQHSVFELVEAIGNRNPAAALALLVRLLGHREEPLRLAALVARHLRQLLGAKIHDHMGTDHGALAGLLGVPPFVVKKLLAQGRRFRGREIEAALARLARADVELKSSRRPDDLVLEEAVMDLCLKP
jgi:DNA polymerase III subunit delta